MERKINVLAVPSDRHGVGFYRSLAPHTMLRDLYGDEFNVDIAYWPDWTQHEAFDKYDIIHFHKGLYRDMGPLRGALQYFKEKNIVTVMDLDDNWDLGPQHPLDFTNKMLQAPEKITTNLTLVDYATTTTEIFANKIRKYNKNVKVFPNGVNPDDEQYSSQKNPSDRLRIGFVMGSAHGKDMEQLIGMTNTLNGMGVLDKLQFVLCGYDLNGTISRYDKDGNLVSERKVLPTESVWYKYEQILTDNYRLVSPQYRDFLHKFLYKVQWPMVNNECYRREWTMDVHEFAKHYRNIDILLAPLDLNRFNEVKSELKFIEGGFTRTAVIATNFGPYTIGSRNLIKKGGEIDPEGNCILIDPTKNAKPWVKAIKKLVTNPELIEVMRNNMYNTVKDKYDIRNITRDRAEWYKSIVKKTE